MDWGGRRGSGVARGLFGLLTPRRELLLGAGFCLAAVTAVAAAGEGRAASAPTSPGPTRTSAMRRAVDRRAVSRVHTRRQAVALSFDDGPDPEFTPAVLDLLARYDASATFFCVGSNAQAHPELVARILGEGHVVANHTQDHVWLDRVSPEQVRREIVEGARSLARAGVRESELFRPPRGWTSPTVARTTGDLGVRSIFWSDCIEAHHRAGRDPVSQVVANAGPGSIILAHDGGRIEGPNPQRVDRSHTVETLPAVLEGLRRRGFELVTLPQLLRSGRPA